MALREFSDENGREWRVWDVTAEKLHPATRTEDYMRDYLDGWLAFEAADGAAKCRLSPIPRAWTEASDDDLRAWLHRADPVRRERSSGPHGRAAAEAVAHAEAAAIKGMSIVQSRTFRFPRGRYWSVAEWTTVDRTSAGTSGERRVLRFTSGNRNLELTSWPADWASFSDEQLAGLLTERFPREFGRRNPTVHRRRAGDPPPDAPRA